jgi:hypothetical protein
MRITEFGARPHQRGGYSESYRKPGGATYHLPADPDKDALYGPVKVLVKDGKAVSAQGAELLRRHAAKPV